MDAVTGEDGLARCPWGARAGMLQDYHDVEWGLPVEGENAWFERLALEGFQAGLSWATILAKRPRFREVFHGFDVDAVAGMGSADMDRLLSDPGIVRNRAKIKATVSNAALTVSLRPRGGLEALVAQHAPSRTPRPTTSGEVPTLSAESVALSTTLRGLGYRFVGPTIVHALMEATGVIDTHLAGCHRRGSSGVWGE